MNDSVTENTRFDESTEYDRFEKSSEAARRLLRQEELILDVTCTLAEALDREGMMKTSLAQNLGRTKGFVSQLLAGGRNLTLRTIADMADALGYRVKVVLEKEHRNDEIVEVLPSRTSETQQLEWALRAAEESLRSTADPSDGIAAA